MQIVNVALLELASCDREIFGLLIYQDIALYELAAIEPGENQTSGKIKSFALKPLLKNNPFKGINRHLVFAFSPSSTRRRMASGCDGIGR